MKYTYCEMLMWYALTPAMFRYLMKKEPAWDTAAFKKRTKQIYKEMVHRTPEIGSLKENSLRICLAGGMAWLSAYKAADGKMSEERFAGMVASSMESPLVKKSFESKAKTAFTLEAQKRRAANAAKGNAQPGGEFNWNTEVILGRDADEYTIIYRRCGLCGLARQEKLFHLLPHMCVLDIKSVEWMGGVLYRTKTLAEGGDCCDFYICRKDSKWDIEKKKRERQNENLFSVNVFSGGI